MNILAIDPGPTESAWVLWDDNRVLDHLIEPNLSLLDRIEAGGFVIVVMEMVASYGMPVGKSVFDTVLWLGRFWQAADTDGRLVTRGKVKMHLCNSMKAKDSNIRQALIDRFEPNLKARERPKEVLRGLKKDEWSALALAVTYADRGDEVVYETAGVEAWAEGEGR